MKKILFSSIIVGFLFLGSCSSDDNKMNDNTEIEVKNYDLEFKEKVMNEVKVISTDPLIIESDTFEVIKVFNEETKDYSYGIKRKNNIKNYNDINGELRKTIMSGIRDGYLYYNTGGRTCAIYGYYDGDNFTAASVATQGLMNFCYDGMVA